MQRVRPVPLAREDCKELVFLLDRDNNYDLRDRELTNVKKATVSDSAVTLAQLNTGLATKVSKGRDWMTGSLSMNNNIITNSGTPPDDWTGALVP